MFLVISAESIYSINDHNELPEMKHMLSSEMNHHCLQLEFQQSRPIGCPRVLLTTEFICRNPKIVKGGKDRQKKEICTAQKNLTLQKITITKKQS